MRRNHSNQIPVNHLVLDTETTPVQDAKNPRHCVHRLRIGCATSFRLTKDGRPHRKEHVFTTPEQAIELILSKMHKNKPLWVWAHNLGFDLSSIQIWRAMAQGRLSLKIDTPSLPMDKNKVADKNTRLGVLITKDPPTVCKLFRPDGATVWFVDTLNWFFCPLTELGEHVGLEKLPMPGEIASDDDWLTYCRRDCEILERVVTELMGFVRSANLGNFRCTAGSQAMAWFRHKHLRTTIVTDNDPTIRRLERAAYYGGRREVYYAGAVIPRGQAGMEAFYQIPDHKAVLDSGPVYKLDVNGCYPYVMHENLYPVAYRQTLLNVRVEDAANMLNCYACIASVNISDGCGSWPFRDSTGVYSVMGEFNTVLAGPELSRAISERVVKHVYWLQLYSQDRIFTSLVEEGWKLQERFRKEGKPVYVRLVKQLLNSLHGKFAQRQNAWDYVPELIPPCDWGPFCQFDTETNRLEIYRSIAGHTQRKNESGDHPEALPAIAAYCTSYARELLHRYRWIAGLRHVLYEEADSIHVTEHGYKELKRAGMVHATEPGMLKVEKVADVAIYHGPKDYQLDDLVMRCGLSSKAHEVEKGLWQQTNFFRLDTLLQKPPPDGPVCVDELCQTPRPMIRARVSPDGWTEPILLRGREVKKS